ncbi:MAG: helix-turn-helix transcriptional regulator [Phycisphaerae bacterium]|nr:helix-turn-helix transcriptional regulator [Phycisphaerae bacterium]
MKTVKRQKLESKGWKVGTAYDLLGLSDEEAMLIDLKIHVSEGLRKLRRKRRVTQEQLADALCSSQSRVAKMEAGDPSVSLDLLARACFKLGATSRELERMMSGQNRRPLSIVAEKRASYTTARHASRPRAKAKK